MSSTADTGATGNSRATSTSTSTSTSRATPTSAQSPEAIQRDIERTREQLGRTAGALAHKLDPKAQARKRLTRAQTSAGRIWRERPAVVVGVAVAAVALAAVMWRRNS